MRTIRTLIVAIAFCLIVVGAFCLVIGSATNSPPPQVPSPTQIQTMLYERGYDVGEIDGVVGPQTLKAWDRCICDQSAGVYLNEFTMGTDK